MRAEAKRHPLSCERPPLPRSVGVRQNERVNQMSTILIGNRHFDLQGRLTGFDFAVQYGGPQIEVSMLGIPPISDQEQEDGIRVELLRLGEAIARAAQSPKRASESPRPMDQLNCKKEPRRSGSQTFGDSHSVETLIERPCPLASTRPRP